MSRILMEGLSTAVIGMLVVFLGLIILIAVISLMRVFSDREKKVSPAAPAVEDVTVPDDETPVAEDNGAIAAAITAAISMMLEKEGADTSFVVRRIVRRGARARF